jgi:hypothetical protein
MQRGNMFHVLCLLLATSPAWTGETKAKHKSRTFNELVNLILTEGGYGIIKAKNISIFNLPSTDTPVKFIAYTEEQTADHKEHACNVVYKPNANNLVPTAIILQITTSTKTAEGKFLEGHGYGLSQEGTLLTAMQINGKIGKLIQNYLSINSPEVKKAFNREKTFWLKDSISLKWVKE